MLSWHLLLAVLTTVGCAAVTVEPGLSTSPPSPPHQPPPPPAPSPPPCCSPPSPAAPPPPSPPPNYCTVGHRGNQDPRICTSCDPEIGCTECTPKGQCCPGKGTNTIFRILTNYGEDYNYCAGGHDSSAALHCTFHSSTGCGPYSSHYEWPGGCICKRGFYPKPTEIYYYDSPGSNTSSTYWGSCDNSCEEDFGCPYCDYYGCLGCKTFPPAVYPSCTTCFDVAGENCNQCYIDDTEYDVYGTCISCTPGWTVDPDTYECVHCHERWGAGCAQCDELSCTQCHPEYALKDGTCYACSRGCKLCSTSYNCHPVCRQCKAGWYLRSNGKCRRCFDQYGSDCTRCNRYRCTQHFGRG